MKLHELHVHQIRTGVVGKRLAIARVFPTIARALIGPAGTPGRQHVGFCFNQYESSTFPLVCVCAHNAVSMLAQAGERAFYVHSDALMNSVILKGADHLYARTIAVVGHSWILVSAEGSLQD